MILSNSTAKMNNDHRNKPALNVAKKSLKSKAQKSEKQELTFGQKLADRLASKVGSWPFLIGQSAILAGWVGINLTPGLPHWDESPFILLNLVFSFASAYTAPIVLMSQNRQSDEDRKNASLNHEVNLQAASNIELLHAKMDEIYSQKLSEMMEILKQQQAATNEIKVVVLPAKAGSAMEKEKAETVVPNFELPFLVDFTVNANSSTPQINQGLFTHASQNPFLGLHPMNLDK
ncbi:DUF1003 domain-containing protein [Gloeothece verrucosa]|uniref:DUF1003 domain-containing protein n=1 Tax=Gloeothece verrucosa (strain PCC 7822) TaxID=497965 RepID=E0U734_GLOV7|nr:DUF1003 domain-containing protein [Gloeothece verrucosa]ADN17190.1 protein of unknown function DUF1003 [Gloeothece verrucosa PCC 7822]